LVFCIFKDSFKSWPTFRIAYLATAFVQYKFWEF
jgi:hypothetical protein